MSKETFYFSHDYNARSDGKIKKLIARHGFLGYGLFWAVIEDLYQNANALRLDYEVIAFDLRCDENLIKSIINDFDLFVINGDFFGSKSVQDRLDQRNKKSENARISALARWGEKEEDANALRPECDSNAIKESKVKEKKENDIKEREQKFKLEVESFKDKYSIEMLTNFYAYWSEPNKTNLKMKKELQDTWDTSRRLLTWSNRSKK